MAHEKRKKYLDGNHLAIKSWIYFLTLKPNHEKGLSLDRSSFQNK